MKEAVLWAEKKLEEDLKGISKKRNFTLNEFAAGFFSPEDPYNWRKRQESRNHFYEDSFYEQHASRLKTYILPFLGHYLLTAINDVMIDDWFLELKRHKSDKPLADGTKNKILKCLRIVLEEARRQHIIEQNPAKDVAMINEQNSKRDPFSEIELFKMFPRDEKDLLYIWGNRTWAAYFLVMRDTGFRPGEVAALTPSNISYQYQGVYTESSIDYRSREIKKRIKTSNKGFKYKVGLLTQQTIGQIMKLVEEKTIPDDNLLFRAEGNNPIVPDTANKHLKLSMERLELKLNGRTQYSLRHSFETALAGNVDQKILLELMAHTNYRPEYDHRTPEDILRQLQPALEVIEKRS